MSQPTYIELFAGAGGLSLGLDRAGWRCLGHAEIEPHARAILRYRWPDTPLHGDVSTLDGTAWRGVTMISGGSPCQDLSIAGKREGLTGRRSGLFFHQVRLWRESEAPLLLWENVVGALSSHQGKDFARIISTLLGEPVAVPRDGQRRRAKWATAGYVAGTRGVTLAWRVLDLRRFGVPQRRRRVFIVAARGGAVCPRDVLSLAQGLSGHYDAGSAARQADSGAAAVGAGTGGEQGVMPTLYGFGHGWQGHHNSTYSVLDTRGAVAVNISDSRVSLDPEMGTLGARSGGQEVGAQTRGVVLDTRVGEAIPIGEATARQGHAPIGSAMIGQPGDPMFTLTSKQHGVLDTREPLTFKVREGCEGGGKGYLGAEGEAFTLGTSPGQYVFDQAAIVVRATGQANAETLTGECPTLTNNHDGAPILGLPRPRRLMPVETERLMSWPDHWTAIGIDEQGREYRLKDTPRYKCCGNGVASVVAEWIGRRILLALAPAQLQEAA